MPVAFAREEFLSVASALEYARGTRRGLALFAGAVILVAASALQAQTPVAQTGRVDGVAYDSLRKRLLAGTIVQLIEASPGVRAYSVITDELGRFHFDSVRAGSYVAGMLDPLLDTLGVLAPYSSVAVAEGTAAHVSLAIPSALRLTAAICATAPGARVATAAGDSAGLLVGHVFDATGGGPAASSVVAVVWRVLILDAHGLKSETRQVHAKANSDGWFAICGLDAGEYEVRAELGARNTGFVDFTVQPHEIERISLMIGLDSDRTTASDSSVGIGGATISGVVTAGGKPVEGAQVAVEGSTETAATDARGIFTLLHVPDGTRMVEARALGFAPTRVRAEPSRAEQRTVTIAMEKRVNTLDAVTVYGTKGKRVSDLNGFLRRQRTGFGKFLTRAQIDAANAFSVCDLFRRIVGLRVDESGLGGCHVTLRNAMSGASGSLRQCEPDVYLDGMRFGTSVADFAHSVSPGEIMGIEVYTTATEPPQYPGACGSIVVWTRT
jgi:hypothetical protein